MSRVAQHQSFWRALAKQKQSLSRLCSLFLLGRHPQRQRRLWLWRWQTPMAIFNNNHDKPRYTTIMILWPPSLACDMLVEHEQVGNQVVGPSRQKGRNVPRRTQTLGNSPQVGASPSAKVELWANITHISGSTCQDSDSYPLPRNVSLHYKHQSPVKWCVGGSKPK